MASDFAGNLRNLRDSLGLSQAQMAVALGGYSGNTYQMWEKGSRPPADVRKKLSEAGVNLHFMETGEGSMMAPGFESIEVVRDGKTGKATDLKPVYSKAPINIDRNDLQSLSPEHVSGAWVIIQQACAEVGARPDLMPAKGLGRLLAIVAEKISRGDGEAARAALLDEARDLVSAMSGRAA